MRNYTSAKKSPVYNKPTSVILLYSSVIHTMDKYGAIPLYKLENNKTLIQHQIEVIRNKFNNTEIIIITNCGADKIEKTIDNIRLLECPNDFCGSGYGFLLGLRIATKTNVLCIHGNNYFTNKSLIFPENKSYLISSSQADNSIGIIEKDKMAESLVYGADPAWSEIFLLTEHELTLYNKHVRKANNRNLMSFEIINECIANGGKFNIVNTNDNYINIVNYETLKKVRDTV